MRAHTTLMSPDSQLRKGRAGPVRNDYADFAGTGMLQTGAKQGQNASPSGSGVDAVPQEGDLIQGQFVAQPEADRYFHP